LEKAIKYIEEAIGIYKGLGLKAEVAGSLNNASSFYSVLAGLEETKEARKEQLDKAVEYIEEAIRIRRELGLKADVAMSLNNASNRYSDLAGLEVTKEARKEQLDIAVLAGLEETKEAGKEKLDIAVDYIEEAIRIYKEFGLKADVATSMNNASSFYSYLAGLEETKEARKEKLGIAVDYIEEAIRIRRELGLKVELAHSLEISAFVYSDD
jgi:tetratricopeptide (TPR) repeat protein